MEPWYRVVTPRKEVREGRSFNPDEFAIALGPGGGREELRPTTRTRSSFFSRTYFTQSLTEHTGTVLRRLSGQDRERRPGAVPHHPVRRRENPHLDQPVPHRPGWEEELGNLTGVGDLLKASGTTVPDGVRVATFVGNAWDPRDGIENPWIDLARQIAGERGVGRSWAPPLGHPLQVPGRWGDVFAAADAPVLILFDEVLNFINRHSNMADHFYAFLQNLTVAVAGTTHAAAVVSLPRSQTEMTESDLEWQETHHQGRQPGRPGPHRQRRVGDKRGGQAQTL